MTKHIDGSSNYEKAEPQAVWLGRTHTMEGFKDFRQLIGGNANPCIKDLDAHVGSTMPTAQ